MKPNPGEMTVKGTGAVTFKGAPLTLLGAMPEVGERAPLFELVGNDLLPVILADYKGKTLVLLTVPSLDTSVCDAEARRFNQEAAGLGGNVAVLVASMDLPFAQKRWCAAAGITQVKTASAHKDESFGRDYGVLVQELRLLARAVFVIDGGGVVRYVQLVPEVAREPNYGEVLAAIRAVTG